jgi:hypothetical protein
LRLRKWRSAEGEVVEGFMRRFVLSLLLAMGMGFAAMASVSAAPVTGGQAGQAAVVSGMAETVQYAGYCERLRRACIYKEERGEVGRGNCHRYRVECGRARYCERLRQACRYKYERGEQGEGNCRRYRYECGASY